MSDPDDLHIVDVHDHAHMAAVSDLFDRVWGRDAAAGRIMSPEVLTAIAHAGGQVSAVFEDDDLVAATAAFVGLDDGQVFLHSHITGVLGTHTSRGIGRALKWHQRDWCLGRGIGHVRWTFDPLVRRNAWLNLGLLGARALRVERDLYGRVPDVRNAGAPTDRLLVDWELDAPRVRAAAGGRAAAPDVDALRRTGAMVLVDVGGSGQAVVGSQVPPDVEHGARWLVRIPPDIERLRSEDSVLADEWAVVVREVLTTAFRAGADIRAVTPDGWYLLAAGGPRELSGD
ncbi:MAG: hypothetical protein WD575_02640 [Nitriliruptoraceae bacterium]